MNWGTAFKWALGALATGAVVYGTYRGYQTVRESIRVDQKNRAELARIQRLASSVQDTAVQEAALNEVVQLTEQSQQALEAAVTAAGNDDKVAAEARKASYRTGGIVPPEAIIQTQVLCEDGPEEAERKICTSFYSGIVDAAITAPAQGIVTDEQWVKQMDEAVANILLDRVNAGSLKEEELTRWSLSKLAEDQPYPLPPLSTILALVKHQGRDKVILHFVREGRKTEVAVPREVIVASADDITVDVTVEMAPG